MLPHSDTLSRFQANHSLLFLLNAVCLAENETSMLLIHVPIALDSIENDVVYMKDLIQN